MPISVGHLFFFDISKCILKFMWNNKHHAEHFAKKDVLIIDEILLKARTAIVGSRGGIDEKYSKSFILYSRKGIPSRYKRKQAI